MRKFAVVSLFAGAGGLDWGFHTNRRYRVIFANEIDKMVAQTYMRNFDVTPIYRFSDIYKLQDNPSLYVGDVSNIRFNKLKEIYGDINVVIGGPPCQDFSIVRGNNQKGTTVRRGKLYAHFLRAVKVLQPEVFVFENVPGLKFTKRGLPYHEIIEDFRKLNLRWSEVKKAFEKEVNGNGGSKILGYRLISADIVELYKVGVPQMRQRLIIIGIREDLVDDDTAKILSMELKENLSHSLFSKYPLVPIEVLEGFPLNDKKLGSIYSEVIQEYEGIWNEVEPHVGKKWKEKLN